MNSRQSQNQPLTDLVKNEYAIEQSYDHHCRSQNLIQSNQLQKRDFFCNHDQNQHQQLVSYLQNFQPHKYQLQSQVQNTIKVKQLNNKLQEYEVEQQNYQHFDANWLQPQPGIKQYNQNPNYKQIEKSQEKPDQSTNKQNQKEISIRLTNTNQNQIENNYNNVQQIKQILSQQKKQPMIKKSQFQLIQYGQNDDIQKIQLICKSNNSQQVQYSLKFKKYSFQYFLRIQTQIFTIQVNKTQEKLQTYFIKRRFSDFAFLYQSIFINHLGYVLYPFPEKNLQTFLKLKLNLNNKNQGQRIELIQKRMLQLQNFLNFLIQHQQLHYSEQLIIFLQQDQIFQKNKKRIQSYIEEYKQIESYSTIKNLIKKGVSFISYYLRQNQIQKKSQPTRQEDISFGIILENVRYNIQKINRMLKYANQFYQVQFENSQFVDIETDIDDLLRLCAKHSSGKQYSKQLANWLSDYFIETLSFMLKSLKQIQSQLVYRMQLSELNKYLKDHVDYIQKNKKIKRRIDRFQRNFILTWGKYMEQFQKKFKKLNQDFQFMWKNYQINMSKIWSQQSKKLNQR